MSFNNDEDGDGLAALFGGITPQGGRDADPGPRRAAPAPAPQEPAAPQPVPPQPAPYAAPASPAYEMPAPASPAYEMPPASQPSSSYGPPSYAPPSYAPPSYAPPSYDLPAPAAPPAGSPYAPPATAAHPETPQYPGLAPSNPAPSNPASAGPAPAYSAPSYPAPANPAPAYPPTAQYPAGIDPTAYAPPGGTQYPAPESPPPGYEQPAYPPPAYEQPGYPPPAYPPPAYAPPSAEQPPAYEPPPVERPRAYDLPEPAATSGQPAHPAPEPIVEPPVFGASSEFAGFEALGLHPPASDGYGAAGPTPSGAPEPHDPYPPVTAPPAEQPLVRAEAAPLATAFPPGPLLPTSTAAVETPEDLERSTALEKAGLVLALITGPIGLVLAIANAVRGGRRRGWIIGVVRASLVLGVISTIVAGVAGYVLWNIRVDQMQHAEIAAASAEFCAAGDADPAIVTAPTLGWPAPAATTSESLALMQAWTDNWRTLAEGSPSELRTGMELLADKGQEIVDAVTASRSPDHAANLAQISAVEPLSGVAAWYATYCVEP